MSNESKRQLGLDLAAWLLPIAILGLVLCFPYVMPHLQPTADQKAAELLALAGDSYGALNALFSGLAFAGVIIAILLQRRELQLQREELSLTRAELARQADAQAQAASASEFSAAIAAYAALLNQASQAHAIAPRGARKHVLKAQIEAYTVHLTDLLGKVDKRTHQEIQRMIRETQETDKEASAD